MCAFVCINITFPIFFPMLTNICLIYQLLKTATVFSSIGSLLGNCQIKKLCHPFLKKKIKYLSYRIYSNINKNDFLP